MSDNINIGSVEAGVMIVGGTGHHVESGTINVHADPASQLTQLRSLLDDLVRLAGQHGVPPQAQTAANEAVTEAAEAAPDTGRLRTLMNAVLAGTGKVGPVAQAALTVIKIISGIENIIH